MRNRIVPFTRYAPYTLLAHLIQHPPAVFLFFDQIRSGDGASGSGGNGSVNQPLKLGYPPPMGFCPVRKRTTFTRLNGGRATHG